MNEANKIIVTRVVLCYKQWELIYKWIDHESLHCNEVEWIIVNDEPLNPPPEHVVKILTERKVRILQPKYNIGRSNARNMGASEAHGHWIDFIDGDDFPLPIDLEFLKNCHADLLAFPVVGYDTQDNPDPSEIPVVSLPWSSDCMFQNELFGGYYPIDHRPCGVIWKRSSFSGVGGFDARFDDAWQDAHIVWKAYQHDYSLQRGEKPKQLYFNSTYSEKPFRLTAASNFNLFRLLENYGDSNFRELFHSCQTECLLRVRCESLQMLSERGDLSLWIRFKEMVKVLLA